MAAGIPGEVESFLTAGNEFYLLPVPVGQPAKKPRNRDLARGDRKNRTRVFAQLAMEASGDLLTFYPHYF
jgi:hypothetical protein